MTYKYPGEDPMDVLGAAFAVDDAKTSLGKISTSWSHSASRLNAPGVWKGDAASAAAEDVGRLKTILTESTTNLGKIYTAMTTYSSALGSLRLRVDTLNESLVKAQSLLATGQSDVRMAHVEQETGDLTPSGAKTLSSDGGTAIRKAETAMSGLDADYARILSDQRNAADTCIAALRTLPDSSTVTTGTNYTAALDKALGLSQLDLAPLLQAEKDAKALANDKQPLDPNDPATQAKIKELNAILAAHHGDAGFDTPFLTNLTPAGLVKLSGMLETMYNGSKPPAIMATVGALQKQFGNAVATSTQHIGRKGQLPQTWVDNLKKAGQSEQTFKVGGTIGSVTIRGYVPLMATLGNGSGYSADLMDQLGNDMKSFEQSHGGSACWLPDGTSGQYSQGGKMNGEFPMSVSSLNWDWGTDKNPAPDDPFSSWSSAMAHSPAGARTVFSQNNTLLKYLLDQRDWSNDGATYIQQGTNSGWHHIADDDPPGLGNLGHALDLVTLPGKADAQSRQIYENLINDLGDPKNNPRIGDLADSGHIESSFKDNDWIPAQLRPSLGDIVVKNIDDVHLTMTHSTLPKTSLQHLSNVLGDLGKDPYSVKEIKQAEYAYASSQITHDASTGSPGGRQEAIKNELNGVAGVNGLLDYGQNQGSIGEQQSADEAQTQVRELAASAITAAVSKPLDDIPYSGVVIDPLSDIITSSLGVDHTGETNAAINNYDYGSINTATNTVTSALYQSIPTAELQKLNVIDPSGHLIPYGGITPEQHARLDQYLTSQGINVTGVRGSYVDDYGSNVSLNALTLMGQ